MVFLVVRGRFRRKMSEDSSNSEETHAQNGLSVEKIMPNLKPRTVSKYVRFTVYVSYTLWRHCTDTGARSQDLKSKSAGFFAFIPIDDRSTLCVIDNDDHTYCYVHLRHLIDRSVPIISGTIHYIYKA